jgi:2-keto-3-deoxy-L-rhamnonate aldolase RhmA
MTADPSHAAAAQAAGVDRIGIDLEVHGKAARQVSRPSWIAGHTLDDMRALGAVVPAGKRFARIHPFELGGRDELEQVLALGARFVMLPMFSSAAEALEFVRAVDSRAVPVLLLETVPAVDDLDALLASDSEFEVHVGLNDLGISRGHASPFHVLLDPLLSGISRRVVASGRRLAVGRLARPADAGLPVPADLVCALTVSLGAGASFVSQYFARGIDPADPEAMAFHVDGLRRRLAYWSQASPGELSAALDALKQAVDRIPASP